jgi:hypothetical protein
VAAGALIGLAASIPARIAWRLSEVDLTHVASGVARWSPASQPPRARAVGRQARFYVPGGASGAVAVEFELQRDPAVTTPVEVDVRFNGEMADRVTLDTSIWRLVHLRLPADRSRFHRVELEVRGDAPPGRDTSIDAGVVMTWIRVLRGPS